MPELHIRLLVSDFMYLIILKKLLTVYLMLYKSNSKTAKIKTIVKF